MKKVDADDTFRLTESGLAESPVRPGYTEDYSRRVVGETGSRYLMR